MSIVCDFHIHSKYSRATSKEMNLKKIAEISQHKGVDIVGTGDFVHPGWLSEIKEELVEDNSGLLTLKNGEFATKFILSAEISSIYKKNGKTRKIHNIIIVPTIEIAEKLSEKLGRIGNITSDGRPILGLDSKLLLEIALGISEDIMFIPAHIWTPWFSLFGQKSGFDNIEECFEDLTDYIFALETGLSSDPPMNWRWSALDRFTLISNSDAHSPLKISREATIIDSDKDYYSIKEALKNKDKVSTIEFYPEEGKYHFDGHRKCNVRLDPEEAIALNNICPVCKKPLTMGVYHRIVELGDRNKINFKLQEFINLVPLQEILSEILEIGVNSKKVKELYKNLLTVFESELTLLKDVEIEEIEHRAGEVLSVAIKNMRENKIYVEPGFDGEYGKISVLSKEEKEFILNKSGLFKDLNFKLKQNRRKSVLYNIKSTSFRENVSNLKNSVDNNQQKAINSKKNITIIQAGPGTGKTFTLIEKAKKLVEEGVPPELILILSFTNKACDELKERLNISGIKVATFHKIAMELLKDNGVDFKVFTGEDQEKYFKSRDIINQISKYKKSKIPLDNFTFKQEFMEYEAFLKENNFMDFDDLIINGIKYADTLKYLYILIDEFQDIDYPQFELIKKILKKLKMLFVIGDKNQSIYGFRGCSNIFFDKLKELSDEYEEIILKKSFRSCQNILNFSYDVLGIKNPLTASRECVGEISLLKFKNEREEAEFIVKRIKDILGGMDFHTSKSYGEDITFKDIAILFRVHFISRTIEKVLQEEGIPYEKSKNIPYSELDEIELKAEKIKLLSFHASKGLDFKVVFIIGCEDRIIPFNDDLEEEKRLLFVAITRAKDKVFLSSCKNRFLYGEFVEDKISRYLNSYNFKNIKLKQKSRGIFF